MTTADAVNHLRSRNVPDPSVLRIGDEWVIRAGAKTIGAAPMLRLALADAGHPVDPKQTVYAAVGAAVMDGEQNVATARSATMARRIVNALNSYRPGSRGY